MRWKIIRQLPAILHRAFSQLRRSDPLILASSTAFFTTFSLAPIIAILVNVLSLYFKSENISDELFEKVRTVMGAEAADQIESMVNNFKSFDSHWSITVGGSLFLVFVATTLLHVIKHAIHQLWHIKRKSSNQLKYNLKERLTSFAMILVIGILFLITLLLDASMTVLQGYLQNIIPSIDALLIRAIHTVISILAVTAWFTILFKALPDAKVAWRVAIPGGLVTGILFNVGEFILGKLLDYSNIATIFGASASIALILLFIFYSSMIIYFGASFTYEYAREIGRPVKPHVHSAQVQDKAGEP